MGLALRLELVSGEDFEASVDGMGLALRLVIFTGCAISVTRLDLV